MLTLTKQAQAFVSIFIVLAFLPLFFLERGELVMTMNETYTHASILFFRAVNTFAFVYVFIPILLFCLFVSYRKAILALFFIAIHGFLIGIFKEWLARDAPRPRLFFLDQGIELRIGEFVKETMLGTFPSGHSTTAFSIAFFLMLMTKNPALQIAIFCFYCVAAFARVYLGHHFYVDVYSGFLFGLLTAMLSVFLFWKLKVHTINGGLKDVF